MTCHLFSLQVDQSSAAAQPQETLRSTSLRSVDADASLPVFPSVRLQCIKVPTRTITHVNKLSLLWLRIRINSMRKPYTCYRNLWVVVSNLFTDWLVSSLPLCRKTRWTTLVWSSTPPALKSGNWLERRSHTRRSNCQTAPDRSVPALTPALTRFEHHLLVADCFTHRSRFTFSAALRFLTSEVFQFTHSHL